ncbi:MAG TPA: glycosyltransferase family 2 protein [Methylomirabilota bacterium]|nr:glycosyltransferase family 2 protein [Methylomirabilota bacterium]
MKLSVIIPVYNEESTIRHVLERVRAVDVGMPMELIVVDDGSTDRTAETLRSEATNVSIVHFSRVNSGKGTAIRVGLTYASGDVVIIQDADLELDPQDFRQVLKPIVDGKAEIVYGSRFLTPAPGISLKTRVANRLLTALTNLLYRSRLTDMETAYKAFRRSVLDDIRLSCRRFDFEPEVTAKLLRRGHTIAEVPISYRPRSSAEGKKIRFSDGLVAIWTLLKYRIAG